MERAPYFDDVADGPPDGGAWWVSASDGVRLRIGYWPCDGAKGTVLLYPGRTEYIEKYSRAATDLAARGYATLAIDWRGQGLSDRLTTDQMAGHVHLFADYQRDVAAMLEAARALDVPNPLHLLAHSMGGCIGLRAVMDGLPVASCAFSGPMWGIQISATLRPVAWSLSWSGRRLGMGHVYAPGGAAESYVLKEPFASNKLTNDAEMYQHMVDQTRAHPELGLGGPSLRWLHEALRECLILSRRPSPDLPCLTVAGSDEMIVDMPRIKQRMRAWPKGTLYIVDGGRHEVLMDTATVRDDLFDRIGALYDAQVACRNPSHDPSEISA
ncbi:alpha/beta hydrolase [Roseovarius pelagicus]|uniref:Alpha/beta hydrolase n=1 Tax=Roseovarius pelagicus TaxID=2980108 RepID=A0ABY6DK73_9RHOB|nr:alpha/beta hydrolase [Roseovarius pelagicus]UXX84170.1 alpha/beta hydrolase [Roseovarius pelagicus]